jgi:hypothetical protein
MDASELIDTRYPSSLQGQLPGHCHVAVPA